MSIRFITDYPAAFIPEKKILVIAELHLGLEHELYKNGIYIPAQREKFLKTIEKLIKLTKARTLVILGDIKHKVPGATIREDIEIPRFLNELKEKIKVILVKGNHDDQIEKILPKGVKICSSRGLKIGKYGFFHGHAWPSKKLMGCDYLFMGHIHPAVEFRDTFGFRLVESIWIKGRLDEKVIKNKYKIKKTGKLNIIILPVFNKLLGGVAVNKLMKDEFIGPLLTNNAIDIGNSDVYLLDGTHLGKMKNLKH